MSKRLVKIGEAARLLGASVVSRKWEATGELLPARRTKGGTHHYNVIDIIESNTSESPTIGYARVSSHDQIYIVQDIPQPFQHERGIFFPCL